MPKSNEVEPPKDERPFGEAMFNYTSYDGRFIIGADLWAFETRWSSAGQGFAHLMNDPPGIEGVAIAEGVVGIGQVTPDVAAAADFTSRVRTPKVGQVALLRNTAGFYAAVQPTEIAYSHVPSANVMRLCYAINTERLSNFSSFASAFNVRQALIDQLIAAAGQAEQALQAVAIGEDAEAAVGIGIGHNHPPAEFAIREEDRAETLAAIAIVRQETVKASPAYGELRAAGQTIARVVGKIAKWVGDKADVVANEFAKALGKAVGIAAVGSLAAWLTLQGKLAVLVDILAKFAG